MTAYLQYFPTHAYFHADHCTQPLIFEPCSVIRLTPNLCGIIYHQISITAVSVLTKSLICGVSTDPYISQLQLSAKSEQWVSFRGNCLALSKRRLFVVKFKRCSPEDVLYCIVYIYFGSSFS